MKRKPQTFSFIFWGYRDDIPINLINKALSGIKESPRIKELEDTCWGNYAIVIHSASIRLEDAEWQELFSAIQKDPFIPVPDDLYHRDTKELRMFLKDSKATQLLVEAGRNKEIKQYLDSFMSLAQTNHNDIPLERMPIKEEVAKAIAAIPTEFKYDVWELYVNNAIQSGSRVSEIQYIGFCFDKRGIMAIPLKKENS